MGLVRILSWYLNFNGSHFGLPPTKIHRMTGLPPKIVWTMTYSNRTRSYYHRTFCACEVHQESHARASIALWMMDSMVENPWMKTFHGNFPADEIFHGWFFFLGGGGGSTFHRVHAYHITSWGVHLNPSCLLYKQDNVFKQQCPSHRVSLHLVHLPVVLWTLSSPFSLSHSKFEAYTLQSMC